MPSTFDCITDFENLRQAAWAVFKGKRGRAAANALFYDLEGRLLALQRDLRDGTYHHGPYRTFTVADPKPRLISAAALIDRVVHHAIVGVIEPRFERRFIHRRRAASAKGSTARSINSSAFWTVDAEGETFRVSVRPVDALRSLDASVLRITDPVPIDTYPPLSLQQEAVRDRQSLFILHHPLGMPLKLTRYRCQAGKPALTRRGLIHRCDTLGGSSGALLLSSNSEKAVGLHHTGVPSTRPRNLATPIRKLVEASRTLRRVVSDSKRKPAPPPPPPVVSIPPPPPRADMVRVPRGPFFMGCNKRVDSECDADEKSGRLVSVKAFRIDRTEVTVGAYKACVEAGRCERSTFRDIADNKYCNWGHADRTDHPMNCVNWSGADSYC